MRHLSLVGDVSILLPLILSLIVIFSPHTGVVSFQIIPRRQELILRTDATRSSAIATTTTTATRLITTSTTSSKSSFLSLSSNNDDNDSASHPYEYDLAVIGAGPVGVQAAIAAASQILSSSDSDSDSGNPSKNRKMKVVLIDAPRASGKLMNEETNEDLSIGGPTGLFSKALRDTAKRIQVSALRGMGLREDSVWNEIVSSCAELASFNARDIKRQLEYAGVTLVEGYAKFDDNSDRGSHHLVISNEDDDGKTTTTTTTISTDKILIATGSRPFRPSGIPFDGVRVFDSDSINGLNYLPKSVVITGSGIVAIEFAKIFSNLGCDDVTLLIRDNSPKNALMKIGLDKDIAATLVADLIRSGIKIERGCEVGTIEVPSSSAMASATAANAYNNQNRIVPLKISLKAKGGGSDRRLSSVHEIKCDAYVAAVGRLPNTNNLNLEAAGIEVDEYGGIAVDNLFRANGVKDRNVYGAGDVLGRPFLASTGVAQGVAAVKNMFPPSNPLGNDTSAIVSACDPNDESCALEDDLLSQAAGVNPTTLTANPFAFPVGIWSSPEAAYFGLSTKQAEILGIDAGEGIALYAECLRGLVFSPNGLLKLVFQKSTGRIVGVHICGDDACELIHYGMELVKNRRTITDVANSLYSAVTFHEMYRIAAISCMDPKAARKSRAAVGRALTERRRNSSKQ
mmetsp:Transcript_4569/g.6376  ORF Transcript_4569/g.6376 Transcript_4569/m.6376 type:complete len:684 (+) Transcript_4569:104-2155(+)